jgi:uncharacterized protein (TIGR04376 family)
VGLFEDLSRFLESRLEDFLRNNPHLEYEALLEQLREQEEDALKLISDLQVQEKRSQEEILSTAQEIQKWHIRIEKAQAAGRNDLAVKAQEVEASLLREGNQRWGQMQGAKERISQAKELLKKIQERRQEVQAKAAQAQAERAKAKVEQQRIDTSGGWNKSRSSYSGYEDLEEQFLRLETDDELQRIKKNMGK